MEVLIGLSNVLTLKYYSGSTLNTINFTDQEVFRVTIDTLAKQSMHILHNGKPILYNLGYEYNQLTVELFPDTPGIWDYINTIREITSIITLYCYYQNGTQAEKFAVKVNPNVNLPYYAGGRNIEKNIKVVFFESKSGKITSIDEHF